MRRRDLRELNLYSRYAGWPALAAILSLTTVPATLWAQSDDFNDAEDTGWTRYDPIGALTSVPQNSWSFPSGGYRLEAATSPNAAFGPARVASLRQDTNYSNFHITVDLAKWSGGRTNAYGILARVQPGPGPGMTAGYLFGYVSGQHYIRIVRVVREGTQSISGSPPLPLTLDTNQVYRMSFTGKGGLLTGRVFAASDLTHPVAVVTASDASFTSGTSGILAFAGGTGDSSIVDVTFDNYAATDIEPPPLKLEFTAFNEAILKWPADAVGFELECSDTVGASAEWIIPNGILLQDGDEMVFYGSEAVGNKFFRLKRE